MKLRQLRRRRNAATSRHLAALHAWQETLSALPRRVRHEWIEPLYYGEDHGEERDDAFCFDCGELCDMCGCRVGEECGRWRNGVLSSSCSKAGSEECDFECPYSR